MSSFVKPADNLYLHVNNQWLNDPSNQIPSEYPRWGAFTSLYDEGLKKQIALVTDLYDKNKTEEEMKIFTIWEASNNRFQSWKDNTATYDSISYELEILDMHINENKFNNEIDNKIDNEIDNINSHNDLALRLAEYFYYAQNNNIKNVFEFDKRSDPSNAKNVVLDFSANSLSLPSREYYTEANFVDKLDLFRKHLSNVANLINSNSTVQLDESFVENVISFETEYAKYKMKQDQAKRFYECYTNTTLTNFHQKIDELVSLAEKQDNYSELEKYFVLNESQKESIKTFLEKVYSLFNFRVILNNNRESSFVANEIENPPHGEHITVFDGDGVRRIFAMILNENNFLKYRSYLQYRVICAFKDICTKDIDDEFFDFYDRKLNGQAKPNSNDKRSIQIVSKYAEDMMSKLYVARYFSESHKEDIHNMISNILNVMRDSIERNDWLTSSTKEKALIKLSKLNVKVGHPNLWNDYSLYDIKLGDSLYDISKKANKFNFREKFLNKLNTVIDKNEWLLLPQSINAYYMASHNDIAIAAGFIQPPLYCKTMNDIDFDISDELRIIYAENSDEKTIEKSIEKSINNIIQAINFGGIGTVIAHEITHGYDDKGRKFDGDGNMNNWWSEEDNFLFATKMNIMEEQSSQYCFIDEESKKEYKINAKLTMSENLADLGAISLALKALIQYLELNNTCANINTNVYKRIFFKSYANIWKQNASVNFMINHLITNCHSPPDFRANLVKNMNDFYEVFDVNENDNMYLSPNKRIRMW